MHNKRKFKRRKRIFVGAEGQSEMTLISWLQQICDDADLALHLVKYDAHGGDGLAIVEDCKKKIKNSYKNQEDFAHRIILLDSDRLKIDIDHGRNPTKLAKEENFNLIYLKPNIEGFYICLHKGNERKIPVAKTTEDELKKIWPKYKKNTPSADLIRKFTVEDIRRVAKVDKYIKNLLLILGL